MPSGNAVETLYSHAACDTSIARTITRVVSDLMEDVLGRGLRWVISPGLITGGFPDLSLLVVHCTEHDISQSNSKYFIPQTGLHSSTGSEVSFGPKVPLSHSCRSLSYPDVRELSLLREKECVSM